MQAGSVEKIILSQIVLVTNYQITQNMYLNSGIGKVSSDPRFLEVPVKDLRPASNQRILVSCPDCFSQRFASYGGVMKAQSTRCKGCVTALRAKDISGMRFGKILVIEKTRKKKRNGYLWRCICDCGRELFLPSSRLVRNGMTSCRKGECHAWYNPELSDEDRYDRTYDTELFRWKMDVRKKFDGKCVVCGSSESPNSHHLYSVSGHEELKYDRDNGVVLCQEHHIEFHKEYGYGNNTKDQFYTWMKTKNEHTK